jgi:glutamate/tyrosine decarboxylase-like PLP-dependent enzyme
MTETTTLQARMHDELREQTLFDLAHQDVRAYLQTILERPVFPTAEALSGLAAFAEPLPEHPSTAADVLKQLHQHGSPATVATLGGRYFGFVTGSSLPIGLAAKQLATYWDQNSAMHIMSPITSMLETVVEGWLRDLFNLPPDTVASYVSGTSAANLCGLAAARYRLLERQGWDLNVQGVFGAPKLRIVTSQQSHSAVLKAVMMLGFGTGNIEWVDVDSQGRIIPEAMPELYDRTIVILQAGNVNSGSFDPFTEICQRARAVGAWVHIDGAFGLWAGAVGPLQHLTQGMELAHSWAVDGHKTLNTPYDCGILLCADRAALAAAMQVKASYLVMGENRDGMSYTPEMSRRARVVELWAILRYLGREGIAELVYGLHQRATQFAQEIKAIPGFTILNDVVFNQVVVCCENDSLTDKTLARMQASGECWAGGSVWRERKVIRVSVCSWATTPADITRSVAAFRQALEEASR